MADNGLARRVVTDGSPEDMVQSIGSETVGWFDISSPTASFDFVTSASASNSNFYKIIDALQRYIDAHLCYYSEPLSGNSKSNTAILMTMKATSGNATSLQTWLRAEVDSNLSVGEQTLVGNTFD